MLVPNVFQHFTVLCNVLAAGTKNGPNLGGHYKGIIAELLKTTTTVAFNNPNRF